MFVVVYNPETNEVIYQRRMGPNEIMDARKFADKIADDYETEIAEPDGYIPNCCGDIRVEFRPRRDHGEHIWSGKSFYFKREY
jgi:hypothetical protein